MTSRRAQSLGLFRRSYRPCRTSRTSACLALLINSHLQLAISLPITNHRRQSRKSIMTDGLIFLIRSHFPTTRRSYISRCSKAPIRPHPHPHHRPHLAAAHRRFSLASHLQVALPLNLGAPRRPRSQRRQISASQKNNTPRRRTVCLHRRWRRFCPSTMTPIRGERAGSVNALRKLRATSRRYRNCARPTVAVRIFATRRIGASSFLDRMYVMPPSQPETTHEFIFDFWAGRVHDGLLLRLYSICADVVAPAARWHLV